MHDDTDYIATELLKELKDGNARKDSQILHMQRNLMRTIYGFLVAIATIVAGFLLYLHQYDFSSTEETTYEYDATGVYALVDSEGNVIAQDFTPEELESIMEVLNTYGEGVSQNNAKENTVEDQ